MKLNKRQLADCFDVSEETITQWQNQGCPVESRARGSKGNVYDTGAVFAWRIGRAQQRGDDGEPQGDLVAERTRLTKLQADRVAIEIAEAKGQLVWADAVQESWATHIMAARARFLAFPTRYAPRIAPPGKVADVQEILREGIDECLNELASDGLPKRRGGSVAGAQGVEGAPTADSEPVGRRVSSAKSGNERRTRKVVDSKGGVSAGDS